MDSISIHADGEPDATNATGSPQVSFETSFRAAVEIMARLRAPGGCPWDREQTFRSIRRHTIEETYEVLDAIEREDWAGLKDELGDLLLQILFYAEMADEAGYFQLQDVIENLNAKLVRRHPHVFGDVKGVDRADQVLANWEAIKNEERSQREELVEESLLDSVPRALPALMEASKLGSKAASVGFDWNDAEPVFAKLEEELTELRQAMANGASGKRQTEREEEELGDVLFTVVNLARKLGFQAELSLRASNAKFRRRFRGMESMAGDRPLKDFSPDELEALWGRAKAAEEKDRS